MMIKHNSDTKEFHAYLVGFFQFASGMRIEDSTRKRLLDGKSDETLIAGYFEMYIKLRRAFEGHRKYRMMEVVSANAFCDLFVNCGEERLKAFQQKFNLMYEIEHGFVHTGHSRL